jgi:endonuclease-3
MSGLRSTRSAADSRVTLMSADTEPDVKPNVNGFTSLRRATRSTTRAEPEASSSKSTLDLSKYSYAEPARKRVKREVKEEDEPLNEVKDEPASPTRRAPRKEKAAYLPARTKAHPEPAKWREQYALIERMRAGIDAPVDTM